MPHHFNAVDVPVAVSVAFDWFLQPANWLRLAPSDLHLEIVDAPPRLQLGSCLELKARRWGMAQHSKLEITELDPGKLLTEEQRTGPFRQWKQIHRFEAIDGANTRLTDEINYELPGGMLGLIVTAAFVERELTAYFQYRNSRLRELLSAV